MVGERSCGIRVGEFRNAFRPSIRPLFRRGHTVLLAEIMAAKILEIRSGIRRLKCRPPGAAPGRSLDSPAMLPGGRPLRNDYVGRTGARRRPGGHAPVPGTG